MSVPVAIGSTFFGCMSNVVFLELLVKQDPGIGNLITFSQFLLIAIHGFIFTAKFGTKKPSISIKGYLVLVVMFFVTNVLNNYAFDLNIAMPLHMIFRAGSLIANMVMGIIILKKRYSLDKYISVIMITIGISVCTIVSSQDVKKTVIRGVEQNTSEFEDFFWWCLGITCLTVALFISARMGIYQETLYKKHGKHPQEALFYTHLLPLPWFLFLYSNLKEHTIMAFESEPLPYINLNVPSTVIYLIGNVITQYLCISSVYFLTTECSSLTVTLVLTLRKFTSLLFSIIYFRNPFTLYHWIGTILVFVGTIIFTELLQKLSALTSPKKTKTN
ncbi:UDP-xylose and UDP-N-acetylglucosamine transporter [Daktulosphaira vitifoliae]|uniref:UDP-xylose and UDP-N-acetylglucosamine transporter n=1 Tax=Daktulosphaira vitifoliae TaxID=58002 RepID=UPI0021AA2FE7|nr:UDP-xylose and UDP-N-acetylglucosamine transporter [Daktulosphaira vitifoliae]XP_050537906.1 UDP-xylose and UDP-N-acetylglucosamine transporter [Daktulosphaira vitifoliae]